MYNNRKVETTKTHSLYKPLRGKQHKEKLAMAKYQQSPEEKK